MTEASPRKLTMYLAGVTAVVVIAMTLVTLITGAGQLPHEHVMLPEAYATSLLVHASALRALMALDIAFIVLFTAFFSSLTVYLRTLGRPFLAVALGTMVAVAVLDLLEDHHILALLDDAEHSILPSARAITLQTAESGLKWCLSFLSLFMFGLAIPRTTKLGLAFSLALTVGNLFTGALGYAMTPAKLIAMEASQYLGFLVAFGLALAWLWNATDARSAETA